MSVRPGGKTVLAAGFALTLALAAAALAWSQPKRGGGRHAGVGASATGALRIVDSRGGKAILEAPALAPGAAVVGEVAIRNLGADGRLVLSRSRLVETPGAGEAAPTLRLRIRELTGGRGKLVYSGDLAAMPKLHLGTLRAGESRRYRFAARFPEPGLVDNGLMGARVRFDYRWHLRRQ